MEISWVSIGQDLEFNWKESIYLQNFIIIKKQNGDKKKMKNKISKKIIGGLIIISIIATIGAVIVSADLNDDNEDKNWLFPCEGKGLMIEKYSCFSELTEEQREELKELKETLIEEGKTSEEIRDVVRQLIESYGIELPTREERLDNAIANTEQRLEILQYVKELITENPDLTKEEIKNLIEDEFDIDLNEFNENEMNFRHRFHRRNCGEL